jgi:4-carboxymuconolactone decarboxylase
MPPIPADQMTDAQKKAAADFRASRGTDVFGPFVPLLRSPQLMTRAEAMGTYLRYNSILPPRLSEFVILLTARRWTQQYEWGVHQPIAVAAGLAPETVRAIAEGRRPDRLTDDETILYEFCDELQRNQSVSDAAYNQTVARFGQQGVVDIIGLVGYYTLQAMVLNTARVPPDPGAPTLASPR